MSFDASGRAFLGLVVFDGRPANRRRVVVGSQGAIPLSYQRTTSIMRRSVRSNCRTCPGGFQRRRPPAGIFLS